jgi:hypothetical protein
MMTTQTSTRINGVNVDQREKQCTARKVGRVVRIRAEDITRIGYHHQLCAGINQSRTIANGKMMSSR